MKRKIWASSPVFFILCAAMLAMACASWFWNRTAFVIELSVAVAAAAAVAASMVGFRAYIAAAVKSAKTVLTGDEYRVFQDFSLPVVIVGDAGDIIWFNRAFWTAVCGRHDCRGQNIARFLYPQTVAGILKSGGAEVSVGRSRFAVYGIPTAAGSALYFVESTRYRMLEKEFHESRPAVILAYFDNREELARESTNSEDTRVASEVEEMLIRWAQEMGGFLKKLSSGRFFILSDERHVRDAMEKRFPVLDAVRAVKAGDRLTATVSLGVSRGAKSPQEAEAWARKALDMALGRGGDQVAVMQGEDTYEFFGGLSKGVEKRDKVRTRVFAATLSDDMKESDTILVMGHRYSDLDCIGAAAGIWSVACKSLGRPAYIVVDREHTLAGSLIDRLQKSCPDEQIFLSPSEALSLVTPKTMLVVVDTHSPDFVESTDLLSAVARVVVIDHHRMMVRHIENALVFYHEPFASSASEMVAELVQYLGDRAVTPAVAEAMLAGVMLDTKYFVLKTGVRTFEAAAYLRRKGADTVTVKRMFSDSIDAYKAKYRIVSNARMYGRFAVASTDAELPDIRVSAAQAADELLSIQGVDASFVIYPAGGVVNVSARSLGEVNVQLIMEALGGGGHLTMAGAQLSGVTVDQAREKLVAVIQAQKGKPHKS